MKPIGAEANSRKAVARSRTLIALCLAAALGALSACTSAVSLEPNGDYKARVGYYPGSLLSFPAFVAKEQGFYEQNGLIADLVSIPNGSAMTAAVANGSVSFGNNSYDNLALSVAQDLPIKAVSGNTTSLPIALIAREDLAVPSGGTYPDFVEDLRGKRLGVIGLGISMQFITEKLVTDAGYSIDEFTVVAAGLPDAARPALQQGTIDTYTSVWPLPAILEASGEGKVLIDLSSEDAPESLRNLNYNGWWANDRTIESDPEAVEKFSRANESAICWSKDPQNFDELVRILEKNVPIPQLTSDQYRSMVQRILPSYGIEMTRDSIDRWQEILIDQKLIESPLQYEAIAAATVKEDAKCP